MYLRVYILYIFIYLFIYLSILLCNIYIYICVCVQCVNTLLKAAIARFQRCACCVRLFWRSTQPTVSSRRWVGPEDWLQQPSRRSEDWNLQSEIKSEKWFCLNTSNYLQPYLYFQMRISMYCIFSSQNAVNYHEFLDSRGVPERIWRL